MTIEEKIQSIRSSMNVEYNKPSEDYVLSMIKELNTNQTVLDYLQIKRNLTNETIEHFKLGYNKEKNAVSIPVYKRGIVVNIKYRNLDENANVKYTQEKGCEVWLYNEEGIDVAKKKGGVLITEGEFDCMSAWQAGFKNVISPASGKDSYGIWIELLDVIPKVFIAYDNDKPGKLAGIELSERIGVDKSYEVKYPDGIKDANDYFKVNDSDSYKELIRKAKPYYKYTYQGLDNVIELLKIKGEKRLELKCVPFIKIHDDWLIVVSGISGVGKTTYVMNIAAELVDRGIPSLIFPFERGIKDVGARFLQTKFNHTEDELVVLDNDEWDKMTQDVINYQIYFSTPKVNEIKEVVEKAKKLFGVKVVIIDHLNYAVVPDAKVNQVDEMQRVLQSWKTICIENNIIFVVVHHIRKSQTAGSASKNPTMEDLKGGSSSFQVAESVIMLSSPEDKILKVEVQKNKGKKGYKLYEFNEETGLIGNDISDTPEAKEIYENTKKQGSLDDF